MRGKKSIFAKRILSFKKYFLLNKKEIVILLVIFILSVWAGRGVFKYNICYTHDFDHHIARSYDAIKTIREGHFPLRWAGSLNYSCGVPIYNFFYPLLYYLVIILELFTKRVIFSLEFISFLSLPVSAIFFYLWMKEEIKNKLAAFTASVLYLFAPYRFSLIYVRGSPEFLAYAILPIYLYFFSLLFKKQGKVKYYLAFTTSLVGSFLTISHNFAAMFMMPIVLGYLILKLYLQKMKIVGKQSLIYLITFISAFGLGAFFIGPAFLEKKFIKIGRLGVVKYYDHFPELWQLIYSRWGYLYSAPGTKDDGMSFMLGYAQWILLGFVFIFLLYQLRLNRSKIKYYIKENIWLIILFILSLASILMMLPYSGLVWKIIPIIQQIQFPWRLLGISTFLIGALSGFFLDKFRGIGYYSLVVLLVVIAIWGNRDHLTPQPVSSQDLYKYSDFEKIHPNRYTTTTLGDDVVYINAPTACNFDTPLVSDLSGKAVESELIYSGNTYGLLKFTLDKDKISSEKMVFKLGYYPDIYKLDLNGELMRSYDECLGRVCFDKNLMRDGENFILWHVTQTPMEKIFNGVSLAFLLGWIVFLIINRTKT